MKARVAVAMIVCLMAVSACVGTRFSFDRARQIKVGMTESQVRDLMGRPYSVTARGDMQIWTWVQVNAITGANQSLAIPMKDGKVQAAPTIPDSIK